MLQQVHDNDYNEQEVATNERLDNQHSNIRRTEEWMLIIMSTTAANG